jgi:hypothetical protein
MAAAHADDPVDLDRTAVAHLERAHRVGGEPAVEQMIGKSGSGSDPHHFRDADRPCGEH